MEDQVGTVQNTIQKLGTRTRAINRSLRDLGEIDSGTGGSLLAFPEGAVPSVVSALAASGESDG